MSEPKYPRGPYSLVREGRGRLLIKAIYPRDGASYAIAQVMAGAFGTTKSDAAALLFSAAPEMADALLAFKKAVDAGIEVRGLGAELLLGEAVEKAVKALRKAGLEKEQENTKS